MSSGYPQNRHHYLCTRLFLPYYYPEAGNEGPITRHFCYEPLLEGWSTGPRDDRYRDHAKFDDVKDGCLEPTVYFVDVTKTKLKSTKFRLSGNRHSQVHFAHWHNWQLVLHLSSSMCLEIQSLAPRRNRTRSSVQRSATASSVEKMDLTTWMFVLPKFGNELELM